MRATLIRAPRSILVRAVAIALLFLFGAVVGFQASARPPSQAGKVLTAVRLPAHPDTAEPSSPASAAEAKAPHNPAVIRSENAESGTSRWQITNYASAGEIQAYASVPSVNAGESLDFYVSTRQAGTKYRIDFYRMGWYGGAGARLARSVTDLAGMVQGYAIPAVGTSGCSRCHVDATTGLLDANWLPSYRLDVPQSWLSGAYLALLTDAPGKQTYVPFVVRQDDRPSALLVKLSFNTYQAYNAWGGKSLYATNSIGAPTMGGSPGAVKVSFNRPFDADEGSGQFLRYEYNLVRWLERSGYDVSYVTDVDISANPALLRRHRGLISAGHDEYWTLGERQNVERALASGVHLAFLSGDAVYWQARYEPSEAGVPNRTLVVYRGSMDPLFTADPVHATVRWQDAPLNKSEHLLTGTVYGGQTEPFVQDWVVIDTSSWVFAGTGLHSGDHVTGLVGKEFDRAAADGSGPPGLQILSHSILSVPAISRRSPDQVFVAETTIYTAPSGATVFSAGTVTWSWGLDDVAFLMEKLHTTPVSPAIQRLTANLLDMMSSGVSGPP